MDNYYLRMKDIVNKYYPLIYTNKNIVGVGIGNKNIKGNTIEVPCLTFYVQDKISEDKLDGFDIIPKRFCGVLTDIVDIGVVEQYSNLTAYDDNIERPVLGGDFICNSSQKGRTGTLSIAVTDIPKKLPEGAKVSISKTYVLSTARVLTGNFKSIGEGDIISQKSGVVNPIVEKKLGLLTKCSTVKFVKKGTAQGFNERNELDTGIAFVDWLADPSTNQSKEPQELKLGAGLWNGFVVKIAPKDIKTLEVGNQLYTITKTGGVSVGKIESKYVTGCYGIGDKDAYFKEQFVVDMKNIQYWDYGALIFRMLKNDTSGEKKIIYAVGQIIGHLADGKNNKVMFTPIDRVFKFIDKQIFEY